MAGKGRIRDEDIAAVRERADIEALVSQHVTLKRSGSSLKGLCPFHDEKSGSFYVSPARNTWHCFGCGEGGDAISFLMKIDNLPFVDAIEHLADVSGITLRYEDGYTGPTPEQRAAARSQRTRLLAVLADAATFYARNLATAAAKPAQTFLTDRGFTPADATQFGCGWSPDSWDATLTYLKGKGHTEDDIITSGIASKGERRTVDRFRGRLMFPIRDASGDVIGFGARKVLDSDDGPKYLNSPETPVYKKTTVLYGIDAARKDIAKTGRAVIVEGYTDVMACHLSGVTTAVATCGTAFGEDHVKVLRRFLGQTHATTGEVIYTFDGDAAGQKAAVRSFELDEKFLTRTFVAIEPSGMDPCELRQAKGPAGVQALINTRVPLFVFALKTKIAQHDITTVEGRINALAEAAPVLARIKDPALRPEYARTVGGWLRMGTDQVLAAIDRADHPTPRPPTDPAEQPRYDDEPPPPPEDRDTYADPDTPATPTDPADQVPHPHNPHLARDRRLLRALIATPTAISTVRTHITRHDFTHPAYAATWDALDDAARNTGADTNPAAATALLPTATAHTTRASVRTILTALAVEPITVNPTDVTSLQLPDLITSGTTNPTPEYATALAIDLAIASLRRRRDALRAAVSDPTVPRDQQIAQIEEQFEVGKRLTALQAARTAAYRALRG